MTANTAFAAAQQVKINNQREEIQKKDFPLVSNQKLEITNNFENSGNHPMAQVTSVSQFSDVQPTDWAFGALQSLVERYSCIAGYPNGTYRGNHTLTRYEFAAGLNACLDRINELIATNTESLITKEDLATLQKLQEEFAAELSTLRGRVDTVEAHTAELEANQFSTTTKLQGQVVVALTDVLAGNKINGEEIEDKNTALGARSRLEFVTSFSGKDTLFTRIQASNIKDSELGTPEGKFFFTEGEEEGTNDALLDSLWYKFPLGENTSVIAIANEGDAEDITETINLFDGDGAFGALSRFGTRNPIYYQVNGAGVGISHKFTEALELSLGYLAEDANDPESGDGLFNGPYGLLAQLTIEPSENLEIGLTYINSYKRTTDTGSNAANLNVESPSGVNFTEVPFSSNSYGVEASFRVAPKITLGGWVGYTSNRTLSTLGGRVDRGDFQTWNYAVTLGISDLGKQGNLIGLIFGMEPKVTSSSISELPEDQDTSYHIEGFYQYQLTNNITITPGIIWLTAPDHNSNNNDIVIGAVRTTLSF
ncbi:iron uptake porin [Fischerella sp. JS2]|uniref:iron uptake porin n=1 Tax=Fischerella sp. JS2 TaxID=2597771 RepID=UPI0028F03D06|nr:iron uptake porin [Fischerella sp. JS2]